jgi:hypothetical protein
MFEKKIKIIDVPEKIKKNLFPDSPINIDISKLQLSDEGMYSISGKRGSKTISDLISKYFGSTHLTITDATANNGTDTITFGLTFDKVNSIEINSVNYAVLVNNVDVYGLGKSCDPSMGKSCDPSNGDKISLYNNDSLLLLDKLKQDVIYVDAPWGGQDYEKRECVRLYLDEMELCDIFTKFRINAKIFVFKVPVNYDFNYFIRKISVPVNGISQNQAVHIHSHLSSDGKKIRFKIIIVIV